MDKKERDRISREMRFQYSYQKKKNEKKGLETPPFRNFESTKKGPVWRGRKKRKMKEDAYGDYSYVEVTENDDLDIPKFLRRGPETKEQRERIERMKQADRDRRSGKGLVMRPYVPRDRVSEDAVPREPRAAAEHHYQMYKYHSAMGLHHEKQALRCVHVGDHAREAYHNNKADHHFRKADHHSARMNAAMETIGEDVIDEGKMKHVDIELQHHRDEERKALDAINRIVNSGGVVRMDDPLAHKVRFHRSKKRAIVKRFGLKEDVIDRGRRALEVYYQALDEGRGRPRKDAQPVEDPDEHPVIQLHKSIALRGKHPFKFKKGRSIYLSPDDAHRALDRYSSLKSPIDKVRFAKRIGHSHDEFRSAMSESAPTLKSENEITESKILDHLHREFGDHGNSLSDDHLEAIGYYGNNSEMNHHLRTSGRTSPYVKDMDHVTSHRIRNKLHLYRGTTGKEADHWKSLKPGDEYVDKGFTGTTASQKTAHDFSKWNLPHTRRPHMIHIIAHPGTRGHYIGMHMDAENKEDDVPDEHEVVLHRGTKFRVIGHSQHPRGYSITHVETVPDE